MKKSLLAVVFFISVFFIPSFELKAEEHMRTFTTTQSVMNEEPFTSTGLTMTQS